MSVRAKKRFGQNFLNNIHVIDKILKAADLQPGEQVMEIGPGLGALTDRLLQAEVELCAVEVDIDLISMLQERNHPRLQVVQGDVLKLDWNGLVPTTPCKLVANLPYNISSQVLFKILDHRAMFSRMILMFQKEVGDRLLASSGNRDYGILSVLMQTWYEVRRVVQVGPGSFSPPPKVDSVVLQFLPLPETRFTIDNEEVYRKLVRGAFTQRRKRLRNSLLESGWTAAVIDEMLHNLRIDPRRRGETLQLEEFAQMSQFLTHHKS